MPKARGEAEALIQEAEAYKRAVISKAEGETARFNKLLNSSKKLKKHLQNQRNTSILQKVSCLINSQERRILPCAVFWAVR